MTTEYRSGKTNIRNRFLLRPRRMDSLGPADALGFDSIRLWTGDLLGTIHRR